MKDTERTINEIISDWADRGLVIEGGWQAMLVTVIPDDAPKIQKVEMRKAYFCGAQHLWASLFGVMDHGTETTEKDLRRMGLIQEELERFRLEFLNTSKGSGKAEAAL